jgi:nitrate reductase (cytochrome), electron transfer subunit
MIPALIPVALAVALAAAPKAVPERQIGLVRAGPGEVVAPPRVKENDTPPGERPARPRAFPGAPPAIPHGIADFLPITREANACIDCHGVAEKRKGEPTPIPASHYVDTRNAPEKRGEKVAGARWSCTACHVPQHDVAPLVKSPFPR